MAKCIPELGCPSCCRNPRSWVHKSGSKPKVTPLPLSKLLVLCATLFVNQFGINMIFPFLPFMIHDFFPYLDKTELGRKAGYLGSAYFIGNFIGSLFWGWMSDKIGRRPILLSGVAFTIACELFFGFSQNFAWAIAARLLWGMLNGNIGVVKTYMSEICDDTNQAKGFAYIGTTGGIGRLLGSVIGGFLARPANKYETLQIDFFCKHPYSLPCIVGAGISFISFVSAWLFLDETLVRKKPMSDTGEGSSAENGPDENNSIDTPNSDDSGIELSQPERTSAINVTDIGVHFRRTDSDSELTQLIFNDEIDANESTDSEYDAGSDTELLRSQRLTQERFKQEHFNLGRRLKYFKQKCLQTFSLVKLARKVMQRITECVGIFVTCALCIKSLQHKKFKPQNFRRNSDTLHTVCHELLQSFKLLLDRKVFLSIFLYGWIAFLAIITNELLPLLLVTSHEHGGYDMDDSEIGIILMVAAIAQLFLQFFVFPRIAKCLGYRHTFKLGAILFGIACILLPLSNRISGPVSYSDESFSGSGSGMGFMVVDNSTDFCGSNNYSDASEPNDNSVSRIPVRVWAVIMTITCWLIFSRMITMTSVMLLISNSSLPKTRGRVNGFGQSLAALGRMIGPVVGAPLFAWSENSGKSWPLNFHLAFDLLVVGAVIAVVVCLFLPRSIEQKRDSLEATSGDTEQTSESGEGALEHISESENTSESATAESGEGTLEHISKSENTCEDTTTKL